MRPVPSGAMPLHDMTADYSHAHPPPIRDYAQIHDPTQDPILVAIAVCGENGKSGWGHWIKTLRAARRRHGPDRADRLFRDSCAQIWGQRKTGELHKPGAALNLLLRKVLA